jgi:hypothetical protein
MASQTPPAVLPAKFTVHPSAKTLVVSLTMSDGELVTGTLYMVMPVPKKPVPSSVPPAMTEDWDTVYGNGSYTAQVLGQGQDVRGVLTGNRGTSIRMELSYNPPSIPLEGVAQDDKGDLFKVAF